jgi:RsiW-degrading membrane proteinase PrsW (M82 family)
MTPRRAGLAIVLLLVISAIAGFAADRIARARARVGSDSRAAALAGKVTGAEELCWNMLQEGPVTVPLLVAFLDAHENAIFDAAPTVTKDPAGHPHVHVESHPVVDEGAIDAFLARTDLPPGVGLLGRYWRDVARNAVDRDTELQVVAAADLDPPIPYANHLLAEAWMRDMRLEDAATRFLREGAHFPERAEDVNEALDIWAREGEWERIDQSLADPRVAAAAEPWLQLKAAIRVRDWRRAARAYWRCLPPPITLGTTLLAAVAALAWGTFCARLGGLTARPALRTPLYLAAFALGFMSPSATLAIASLEEGLLRMTESGDPIRDALFFTFGVGLREELSKLLFLLPLLPILRRKGTRLDVLVCGAIVGLGFAAEENLMYLHVGDLSTAMARFLTANFLHMSMTAIVAGALDEMLRSDHGASARRAGRSAPEAEGGSLQFSIALITVSAMHGAYDYFLSSRDLSWLAFVVFFLLARQFLAAVSMARVKERVAYPHLLETFGIGMALVIGASFVYASALVGPAAAAASLAEGLLGLGIVVISFVRVLRTV